MGIHCFAADYVRLVLFVFHDDWVADYQALGWPLQVIGTVWLIPCYAYYEKYWDNKSL